MKEVTVSIRNSEQTYKEKFLIYDDFTCSENDSVIKECVESALSHMQGEPEKITVRVRLDVQ